MSKDKSESRLSIEMNQLSLSTDHNIVAAEMVQHLRKLGKASLAIGFLDLGINATLKQIAYHAGLQLHMEPSLIMEAMLTVKRCVECERNRFD